MQMAQAILFVDDVVRMQAFYQGVLGLPVITAEPDWVRLDAGGLVLGLHAIKPPRTRPEPAPRRPRDLGASGRPPHPAAVRQRDPDLRSGDR